MSTDRDKVDQARKKIAHAADVLMDLPKEEKDLLWDKEFLAAERISVKKEVEDDINRINKSFYETSYLSIEEDIESGQDAKEIPLSVYSQEPIVCKPVEHNAITKGKLPLTDRQREFCKFMRKRVIVVMSHYANDRELAASNVSALCFRCNVLPDMTTIEKWILPSHVPISIPLYILRHFGCMSPCKKSPIVQMVNREMDEVLADPMMISEHYAFKERATITGTNSFVRFVLLSNVKKKINDLKTA
ncbi:MAG: hypothetical protein ACRC6D_05590 [Aeromonas sp.]